MGDTGREEGGTQPSTTVRVRGIYATALTRTLLEAGLGVVDASEPIRRRFDREFPVAEPDVRVRTTGDRQGVAVAGDPEAVAGVADAVGGTARDTFAWTAPHPEGALFDGTVERTGSGGAVVALGEGERYLPYSKVDDRIEAGDTVRVQVREPAPPWGDDRPLLDTAVRVEGTVASLVRGPAATVAGAPSEELARLTETLSTEVPEGWAVEWEPAAADAGIDALEEALAAAADRAGALDSGLEGVAEPGTRLAAPAATRWLWFGRASRFALDDRRRAVTETVAGHHRIKAAGSGAAAAVDFVERLCPVEEFPTAAVLGTFGPAEGDEVAIEHGKPDGRRLSLGRGTAVEVDPEGGTVTVRREMTGGGEYDALGVARDSGDTATTRFVEGRWWYPTVYRDGDGAVKGTYVNVCTPLEVFPDSVRYVDLYVDVIKHADDRVETVDEAELAAAVEAGDVSESLAGKATDVAERIAAGLRE